MRKNSDVEKEGQMVPYAGCPFELRSEGDNVIEHVNLNGFKVIERDDTKGAENGSISK